MPLNKVILHGNLTRDWELKFLPSGDAVADNAIAINHKWKTEDGEAKEEVTFIDCTVFGKQAETLDKFLRKGDPLIIVGRLKQERWEDKQSGDKRSKLKVVVESFSFVGGGDKEEREDSEERRSDKPKRTEREDEPKAKSKSRKSDPYDDDIPF